MIATSGKLDVSDTIISISINEDKRKEYDTCQIVFDNTNLAYDGIFDDYYTSYTVGNIRDDMVNELEVRVGVELFKLKTIFKGIVTKSEVYYDSERGFIYVVNAVSYEWVLSKAKLPKKTKVQTSTDPMVLIKKLLNDAGFIVFSELLHDFSRSLYKGITIEFPRGTSYLSVIKKICLYMQSIFWIDKRRRAHIVKRKTYFKTPNGTTSDLLHNVIQYGRDIISARFEEKDLDKIFDEVYVYGSSPVSDIDSIVRYRDRNGHAGRSTRGEKILYLYIGQLSVSDNDIILDKIAEELNDRLLDTPVLATITTFGNPYLTSKSTKNFGTTTEREDIVKIVAPIPLDLEKKGYIKLETKTITTKILRRKKNITSGLFFVEAVEHNISANGYTTTLTLSQSYYEDRTGLLQSLEEEIKNFERRSIFTGYVKKSISGNVPTFEVEIESSRFSNEVIAGYATINSSVNSGVIAYPKVGSKVVVARVASNEYYIIGNIYDEKFKTGANAQVDEIRIGEFAIQIDDKGNLKFGSTATGTFQQISLADHTHSGFTNHAHQGSVLPELTSLGASNSNSNTKITCEK